MMGVAPSFESEGRAIVTQQIGVQGLQQSERFKTSEKTVWPGNRLLPDVAIRVPRTERPKQNQAH
jgi:hypothetical protein